MKSAAVPEVPAAAAEALKKLQAAKSSGGTPKRAVGRSADDLKKKPAEAKKRGAAASPKKASDLAEKAAKIKERAAAVSDGSKASSGPAADVDRPSEKSPGSGQPGIDRGALMKKKAEEIKRKMAEAAASGQDETAGPDKTVMMPKRPTSKDGDTKG